MHRDFNITGNPNSTFRNAGILDFWRMESYSDMEKKDGVATQTSTLREPLALVPFTGKEKDPLRLNPQSGGLCGARLTSPPDLFTRFYYFGARYYDPTLSGLFLSVDPMGDKYPNVSPYAYCAWNPVKLVDPDGREVYITGDAADKAANQLSSRGMTVTRDSETGRLSYTLTGKKLSKEDKVLMNAINSKNVIVNVNATTARTVEFEGESIGNSQYTGQFLGVSVTDCENRVATANQLVNPDICSRRDSEYDVPIGISMRHEVTEAFIAGEICLDEGVSCGPCWREWKGYKIKQPEDHVYFKAHDKATPQAINAAPIIQKRREDAIFKMANIMYGMSRAQWDRLGPIFRPHLPF